MGLTDILNACSPQAIATGLLTVLSYPLGFLGGAILTDTIGTHINVGKNGPSAEYVKQTRYELQKDKNYLLKQLPGQLLKTAASYGAFYLADRLYGWQNNTINCSNIFAYSYGTMCYLQGLAHLINSSENIVVKQFKFIPATIGYLNQIAVSVYQKIKNMGNKN